jgi:ankyrin repeat protein
LLDTTIRLRTLAFDDAVTHGSTLICASCFFGAVNCFRYLLANGADLLIADDFGRDVTHFGCARGNFDILSLLSQSSVSWNNIDADGNTCIHYALLYHHPEVAFWLWASFQLDVSVLNNRKMSPLHIAVWNGAVVAIEFLVANGCDVNGRTDAGLTPLHFAASRSNVKVIDKLLECGADLTICDHRGCLPYHLAHVMHHQHVQRLLLDCCSPLDLIAKTV